MSTDAPQPVRGVYVSASNVGYVPLNNYPTTTEYGADVSIPAPAPAVSQAEEAPRRCFFRRRCCNPVPFPRLACWSKLFLIAAVALAAASLGTQKWYDRSFRIGPDDPRAAQLGYAVEYRERIGLFKVCYHLQTTPVAPLNESTPMAEPTDEKHCTSVYQAFRPHHNGGGDVAPDHEPTPPPPSPPANQPLDFELQGRHHGGKHGCRGGLVFCATKGALIAALVFAVLGHIFTCVERRGCCVRRKKGIVIAQAVFVSLAFIAVASALLFSAAGSASIVGKPAAGPLAEVATGIPVDLRFRFSCSFFLGIGASVVAGLAAVLFIIRSARMVDHIANSPPAVQSS